MVVFPYDLEQQFQRIFGGLERVEPWTEQEDNPVDGDCLVGQSGEVVVIKADLVSPEQ